MKKYIKQVSYKTIKIIQWKKDGLLNKWYWNSMIPKQTPKMNLGESHLTPYPLKINLKWITSRRKHEKIFMTVGMAEFLHITIKVAYIRENRQDRYVFIKIKPFCSEKDSVKRMKRQSDWRKYLQITYWKKDTRIYKELSKL